MNSTDLYLSIELAQTYKSASQIARVVTESWVLKKLYCPQCGNIYKEFPPNTKTKDVSCSVCSECFQIKSGQKKIGNRISGAEFTTTRSSLLLGEHPSLILLHYSKSSWRVFDVQFVHRAFLTSSCLKARRPLRPNARRAGWIGSIFDLSCVPLSARIDVVKNGVIQKEEVVRRQWKAAESILALAPERRSWTSDILQIIEALPPDFELDEVYRNKARLQKLHPDNHHLEEKIRQQLQVLREMGKIAFLFRGKYRRLP